MRVFYSLQSQASSPSSSFEVHVYGRTGVETIVAGGPPIHFYPHTHFSQRFINFLLPWRRELSPLYCILSVLCAGRDRAYPKIHSFSFQNENHLARPAPPASHPPTFFDLTHFIHPRQAATTILGRNSPNFDTFLIIATITLFRKMELMKKSSLVCLMRFVGSFIQATKVGRQVKQCIDCC